jgi:hypothetical protein
MQVLVSSDDPFCCDEELIRRIEGVVEGTLEGFSKSVTRVDVRLSDLRGVKASDRDQICRLEARIAGGGPVSVSHEGMTLTEAIHAAGGKLRRAVAREIRQIEETNRLLSLNEETAGLMGTASASGHGGNAGGRAG